MKIKEIKEGIGGSYKIVKTGPDGTTLQSPDLHTMLTLDPEAAKGIVANPENPNQFTLNPATISGATDQGQVATGPKQGAEVQIPANEEVYSEEMYDEDVGNEKDPTDKFIDDVRDKEFEKHNKSEAYGNDEYEPDIPYNKHHRDDRYLRSTKNTSSDKLSKRGGMSTPVGDPQSYKDMVTGKGPYGPTAKKLYGINGPKGKLPENAELEAMLRITGLR